MKEREREKEREKRRKKTFKQLTLNGCKCKQANQQHVEDGALNTTDTGEVTQTSFKT